MNSPEKIHSMRSFRDRAKSWKKEAATSLRNNQTRSERILWEELRNKKLGIKFRRQVIMFGWIVDFYAPSKGVVVELDGKPHHSVAKKKDDAFRDKKLIDNGFRVLRISSSRVFSNLAEVIAEIRARLDQQQVDFSRK